MLQKTLENLKVVVPLIARTEYCKFDLPEVAAVGLEQFFENRRHLQSRIAESPAPQSTKDESICSVYDCCFDEPADVQCGAPKTFLRESLVFHNCEIFRLPSAMKVSVVGGY